MGIINFDDFDNCDDIDNFDAFDYFDNFDSDDSDRDNFLINFFLFLGLASIFFISVQKAGHVKSVAKLFAVIVVCRPVENCQV